VPENSITIERSLLRKTSLEKRDAIPLNMRDAYSQLIRKKTIEYLDSISAKLVHTYISIQSEVGTKGVIEDLLGKKIQIAVPLTRGEKEDQHMIHSLINDTSQFLPGKFGVPEPANIEEVSVDRLDAVIIPIVAFDGFGMRLGYGKGYYDKFLSGLSPKVKRIGLAFSIQEVDKIPKLPHDELMNSIITEQTHFFFK
jgi:5-formyltetrahydrofolate cyclo-ligase